MKYYYVKTDELTEMTNRFLIRIDGDIDDARKLFEKVVEVNDFTIREATFEDVVSSLYYEDEIADLECSEA